nr:D-alanyl-D-alanine carboxypeptidase [Pseudomonadota bacterium]
MQHSGYRYYGCLLLCLLCLFSAGKNAAAVDFLPPEIEKFIKINKVNKKNIGLLLQREDGTIVASHQAERKFNPASVAKIITTLAALDILGTKFTWQTKIATNGRVKKGVVEGDLYLIGGGDPYLTVDNFLYLLNSLRSQGIHEIRGDIIIDDSIFMLPPHNPAKFDGASTKPYNVGAGGLIVNFKTQQIVFAPRDNKVHVYSDPPNAYFTIDNRVKLSKRGCRNWRGKIREQLFG